MRYEALWIAARTAGCEEGTRQLCEVRPSERVPPAPSADPELECLTTNDGWSSGAATSMMTFASSLDMKSRIRYSRGYRDTRVTSMSRP